MTTTQNFINHIALVLDASYSMEGHTRTVVKVVDEQVKYLAQRSEELGQETRITLYDFADDVRCLVYDKDVLRLPSIASLYRPRGNTALIDATVQSQDDLAQTAQLYGDHAFLTFVFTDGQENRSRRFGPSDLAKRIEKMPDNWTVAVMVPDARGVSDAKRCGFFAGNIAEWDTRSARGLEDAGTQIRTATDAFMVGRQSGVRGTRSVFSTAPDALNREAMRAASLKALPAGAFHLIPVPPVGPGTPIPETIREFVEHCGITYKLGSGFYQLTKREEIQHQKAVAIREKKSGRVYTGADARSILGLPDMTVKVSPSANPDYDVFVQSTSVNRKLVPGTKLLLVP